MIKHQLHETSLKQKLEKKKQLQKEMKIRWLFEPLSHSVQRNMAFIIESQNCKQSQECLLPDTKQYSPKRRKQISVYETTMNFLWDF